MDGGCDSAPSMSLESGLAASTSTPSSNTVSCSVPQGTAHIITRRLGVDRIELEDRINSEHTTSVGLLPHVPNPTSHCIGSGVQCAFSVNDNLDVQTRDLSSINWISPDIQATFDWFDATGDLYNNISSWDTGFPFNIEQPSSVDLCESTAPTRAPLSQCSPAWPFQDQNQTNPISSASPVTSSYSPQSSNLYYVDGGGARAPFNGATQHGSPMTQSDNSIYQQDNPLRRDHQSICEFKEVPSASYDALIIGVQAVLHHIEARGLPTHVQVSKWTQVYFDRFHPTFSFIRRSTVMDASSNWLILLAVVTTGACICETSEASEYRHYLTDLLRVVINQRLDDAATMMQEDPTLTFAAADSETSTFSVELLQGVLLNMVCMLHSGRAALISQAKSNRLWLVDACRNMRLLSDQTATCTTRDSRMQHPDWYERQTMVRTGYMIWVRPKHHAQNP